jgi:hypothetical protein
VIGSAYRALAELSIIEVSNLGRLANRRIAILALRMIAIFLTIAVLSPMSVSAQGTNLAEGDNGHYSINFSKYTGGPIEQWIEARGYKFAQDAKNPKYLQLSITDQVLTLDAKARMTGLILNESLDLQKVKKARLTWGINEYPVDVSYQSKVNNEALMVYFFFGKEKISSGHLLVPNSPYFIGLFLCRDDQVDVPYKGRFFHTGGRFVCLGKPKPGETVVSEFNLDRNFRSYFGKKQTPNITGIGFGVDTSKAGGQGTASAFVKSIEFLQE